jgi:hypothetical protein
VRLLSSCPCRHPCSPQTVVGSGVWRCCRCGCHPLAIAVAPHFPREQLLAAVVGGVVGMVLVPLSLPSPCHRRWSLFPTHEQLLAAVVGGAVGMVVIPLPSSSPCHHCCSLFPPHKQLLAAAVGGATVAVVAVWSLSSSSSPSCHLSELWRRWILLWSFHQLR